MNGAAPPINAVSEASAAFNNREFDKAHHLLERINQDARLRSFQTLLMHALTFEAKGLLAQSEAVFVEAEAYTENATDKVKILNKLDDLIYRNPARSEDDLKRAAGYLKKSIFLDAGIGNAIGRRNLCAVLFSLRQFEGTVKEAIFLKDHDEYRTDAELWLADASFYLNKRKQGLRAIDRLRPELERLSGQQIVWLLGILVNYRLFDEALENAEKFKDRHEIFFYLQRYAATVFVETERYPDALEILTENFIDSSPDTTTGRTLHFYRARALDKTGDYQAAHASFVTMNNLAGKLPGGGIDNELTSTYRNFPYRQLKRLSADGPNEKPRAFLIGFPRSGTTLLETILDTQENICTLSETEGIDQAIEIIQSQGKEYPRDLIELSDTELQKIRNAYLGSIEKYLEPDRDYSILIDKMPLNILHIPLILSIFPEARFIFMLRHPLDVCLSCYQQDFILNNQMAFFTDLENTFFRYFDVMNTFETHRENLQLEIHTVKYEDLTRDLQGTGSRLFEFLNVEPDRQFTDFHLLNKNKLIRTPPRDQVTKPIYNSSCGRWNNYFQFIEPYIPIVQPLIDKYGYEA